MPAAAPGSTLPDIQGLRALAVVLVMAYHAGLPLPGGFTGVDVFFVISGYVIVRLILRESTTGFSLRRFYARRFKRLTPALAITVVVVSVASLLLLSPLGPQQTAGATGLGAMLLVANVAIVATSGDYFDDPSADNPLLNTWSLSVEEQFYLVVPALLALALARGRGRRRAGIVLACLTATSFAAALVGATGVVQGDAAWLLGFYSPLARAWEFGVGGLLAVALTRAPGRTLGLVLSAGGLAMILAGALVIDGASGVPGPITLLPVLGAALVIAGCRSTPHPVSRGLSWAPVVRVGDWSYSLYLWHWPLVVFAVLLLPAAWWIPVAAVLVAFLPAVASYRFVEDPMRAWPLPVTGRRLAALAGTWVAAVLASAGLWFSAHAGVIPPLVTGVRVRYPGDLDGSSTWAPIEEQYSHPCAGGPPMRVAEDGPERATCRQSRPEGPIDVAIMGDSHAWQYYPALAEAFPDQTVAWFDTRGLPVPENAVSLPAIEYLQANPPRLVLLSAWWGKRGAPGDLFTTISAMSVEGSRVVVLDDIPAFPFPPEACVAPPSPLSPPRCDLPRAEALAQRESYQQGLVDAVEWAEGGELATTFEYFCDETVCSMADDGVLMYFNDNHLNLAGSRVVVDRLLRERPDLAETARG